MYRNMLRRVKVAAGYGLFVVAVAAIGWLLWATKLATAKELIALSAIPIAGLAVYQAHRSAAASTKSAALAQLNEERNKYGWAITPHTSAHSYELVNTGTLAALDVRFANAQDFAQLQFVRHSGDDGPTILPGQSKAFVALEGWGDPGTEVLIDWRPDGEKKRQQFNKVLHSAPDTWAEEQKQRFSEANREESASNNRVATESRRILIELAGAWGDYQADASAENKARVQGLVGALPSNFVKEIGYAVDVPRDFWGPRQWPLEVFAQPEDKELVRENAAMIELIWNLWQVQLRVVVDGDASASPRPWYRIEDAVVGYVDLVRRRESNNRELIESPRDRAHREAAIEGLEELKRGDFRKFKRATPVTPPPAPDM